MNIKRLFFFVFIVIAWHSSLLAKDWRFFVAGDLGVTSYELEQQYADGPIANEDIADGKSKFGTSVKGGAIYKDTFRLYGFVHAAQVGVKGIRSSESMTLGMQGGGADYIAPSIFALGGSEVRPFGGIFYGRGSADLPKSRGQEYDWESGDYPGAPGYWETEAVSLEGDIFGAQIGLMTHITDNFFVETGYRYMNGTLSGKGETNVDRIPTKVKLDMKSNIYIGAGWRF